MTSQEEKPPEMGEQEHLEAAKRAVATALDLNPTTTPTLQLWPFVGREVFHLSKNSTYRAAELGQIPTIRLGRKLVVPTAALRRMLQLDDVASPAA